MSEMSGVRSFGCHEPRCNDNMMPSPVKGSDFDQGFTVNKDDNENIQGIQTSSQQALMQPESVVTPIENSFSCSKAKLNFADAEDLQASNMKGVENYAPYEWYVNNHVAYPACYPSVEYVNPGYVVPYYVSEKKYNELWLECGVPTGIDSCEHSKHTEQEGSLFQNIEYSEPADATKSRATHVSAAYVETHTPEFTISNQYSEDNNYKSALPTSGENNPHVNGDEERELSFKYCSASKKDVEADKSGHNDTFMNRFPPVEFIPRNHDAAKTNQVTLQHNERRCSLSERESEERESSRQSALDSKARCQYDTAQNKMKGGNHRSNIDVESDTLISMCDTVKDDLFIRCLQNRRDSEWPARGKSYYYDCFERYLSWGLEELSKNTSDCEDLKLENLYRATNSCVNCEASERSGARIVVNHNGPRMSFNSNFARATSEFTKEYRNSHQLSCMLCTAVTRCLPEMRQDQILLAGQLIMNVLEAGVKNTLFRSTHLTNRTVIDAHQPCKCDGIMSSDQSNESRDTQRTPSTNNASVAPDHMRPSVPVDPGVDDSSSKVRSRRKPRWRKSKKSQPSPRNPDLAAPNQISNQAMIDHHANTPKENI